ncbi:MAG: transposase [Planctomycetes bacterium]|nr:transposase [Planctomycetota bacterium]MBM4058198.1 transposase [Planctomycetota bacterium]
MQGSFSVERYLPEAWKTAAKRMGRAGIPAEIGYRPKWQIALEMCRQVRAEGFSGPV